MLSPRILKKHSAAYIEAANGKKGRARDVLSDGWEGKLVKGSNRRICYPGGVLVLEKRIK